MLITIIFRFESNVILDRYKTDYSFRIEELVFESNVILDRYKTLYLRKNIKIYV